MDSPKHYLSDISIPRYLTQVSARVLLSTATAPPITGKRQTANGKQLPTFGTPLYRCLSILSYRHQNLAEFQFIASALDSLPEHVVFGGSVQY